MDTLTPTARTRVARRPQRGIYDRKLIYSILDEALVCHVGVVVDDQPVVLPNLHVRIGDRLYLHGAVASRTLRSLKAGMPVCVTVTLIDGLVLARSAFHHSVNYRSVVVFGTAKETVDLYEKRAAFNALVEHVLKGRSAQCRPADEQETKATTILSVPITEASAKVRSGPVSDADEDYALPYWAGVLPMSLQAGAPIPDERLLADVSMPENVSSYDRTTRR